MPLDDASAKNTETRQLKLHMTWGKANDLGFKGLEKAQRRLQNVRLVTEGESLGSD